MENIWSDMHLEILSSSQKKLIELVQSFKQDFYLVGGTALALQLGHRRSIDFNLFTKQDFNGRKIEKQVATKWQINQVYVSLKNELTVQVEGVKATWYQYPFEIPLKVVWPEVIKMPDPLHIAAMKAYAMGQRAKWKDYIDLYFLFKQYSLEQVSSLATSLFGAGLFDERLLREQLAYYEDVSFKEKIDFLPGFEVSDEEVKKFLTKISTS